MATPGATELEYVTQYVAGTLFGGWYRVLHDGRLELSALGGIWYARRGASLPHRQARALLARLVRMRQQVLGQSPAASSNAQPRV